ncbi:hypothetical protein [Streptomyces fungicidicus]|uniref:hypothetical protein n=1 Tax=Streptomyces fungicidicus TaxID=68203 RepID=UPI003D726306
MAERCRYLVEKRNNYMRIINKLEPLASAMRRDSSDSRHSPFADIFEEGVREAKFKLDRMHTPYIDEPSNPYNLSEVSELCSIGS